MAKFILFDLDGTLIDGVEDLVFAMNKVLARQNLAAIDRPALEAMLGDGVRMLTRRALAARNVTLPKDDFEAACDQFLADYKDTDYARTRLYDGVADTLRLLHQTGWNIGLASNKPTEPCERILAKLGIRDLFVTVAGGDAASVKKPDGGHLRFALAAMGHNPASGDVAVMVGDHANDVDAARDAGIAAIAVAFEVEDARAKSLGADAVLTDFATLPAALAKLTQKAA
ncbi:HAD family hydrolase [Thalassospira sp.]|uniref:HAD family hydrolase n=1 Tax=Thalassospira sp. TaxID=1912094 RepID=UPI0027359760|nr:HAD-IA family hydrolase [Thalassospira sp.]MDP2700001.1 HAD-IA family hydrolase [Thalassospira sp.]